MCRLNLLLFIFIIGFWVSQDICFAATLWSLFVPKDKLGNLLIMIPGCSDFGVCFLARIFSVSMQHKWFFESCLFSGTGFLHDTINYFRKL